MVSKLLMEMTEQGMLARDGRRRILLTPPKTNLLPPQPMFQSSVARSAGGAQSAQRGQRDAGRKSAIA